MFLQHSTRRTKAMEEKGRKKIEHEMRNVKFKNKRAGTECKEHLSKE